MIYTITFNPSVDYYIYLDQLKESHINRVSEYEFIAGGKGINVSRMLANLNISSNCVFFAGGFTGSFLVDEVSQNPLINVTSIKVDHPSRINVKIRHHGETDLNTSGAPLLQESLKALVENCTEVKENDFVCICGSLQNNGLVETIYQIAEIINHANAHLVLDVPNMNKQQIIDCKAYMIKPNLEELQNLLKSDKPYPEILEVAKSELIDKGVESILLSMGKDGSHYLSNKESFRINGPKLKPLNTVAAGDSMLAATVGKLSEGLDIKEAAQWGSACGSAAVLVPYIPDEDQVKEILKQVSIEENL